MTRILIPVDPTQPARTRQALAEAVRLHGQGPVDVYLLNVQPLLTSHVAKLFAEGELQALQYDTGREDLAPARAVLEQHQVPHTSIVRIGRRAETIARTAANSDATRSCWARTVHRASPAGCSARWRSNCARRSARRAGTAR